MGRTATTATQLEAEALQARTREHATQHGRVSLRLLVALELLLLPLFTHTATIMLIEFLALLAVLTFSARKQLSLTLWIISLALCAACEGVILVAPGEPASLNTWLYGLLPSSVGDSTLSSVISAVRAMLDVFSLVPAPALVSSLVIGTAKLAFITLVIAWFGARTDIAELLGFFSSVSNLLPVFRSPLYLLSTLLAILPSIRMEVRKSLDASALRNGSHAALLKPSAWLDTLIDVLVRTVARSERLASTAIVRGFRLREGLTSPPHQRITSYDMGQVVVALVIGALISEIIQWAR